MEKNQDILRYEEAAAILPVRLRKAALALPAEERKTAEELRLRAGQVPSVVMDRRERPLAAQAGTAPVTPEMLQRLDADYENVVHAIQEYQQSAE